MRGERVDDLDLGAKRNLLAEDLDRLSPLDDATTERILRLEAADEDDVVLVLNAVLQVVENPPAFAHA